jgi:hypothetical protein
VCNQKLEKNSSPLLANQLSRFIFIPCQHIATPRGEFMARAMTKSQLIAKVAERASITNKAAADIVDFIAKTACKEATLTDL